MSKCVLKDPKCRCTSCLDKRLDVALARVEELEKAITTAVDALDTVAPGRIEREANHQTHLLSALINRRT
jgi:hypothetical protein